MNLEMTQKFSQILREIVQFRDMLVEPKAGKSYSEVLGGFTIKTMEYIREDGRFHEEQYQLVDITEKETGRKDLIVMKQSADGGTQNFFFVNGYTGNFIELQEGKEEEIEAFFRFYAEKKAHVEKHRGPLKK